MTKLEKLVAEINGKHEKDLPDEDEVVLKKEDLLSTGSTSLNLACTGKTFGGIKKGIIVLFVGDSESGKTVFVLTILAEAARNENFDEYDFIYDNIEGGAHMPIVKFFGNKVKERMEPPKGTKEDPLYSSTVEEMYYNIDNRLKKKKPFIYILDSMDGLSSEEEIEHFEESKAAHEKGKSAKGTYAGGKPKLNSARLRVIANKIRDTGSIVIIISQTRDNIGFGAQFNPKTRAGGKSLRFYCRLELWTSVVGQIKKNVKGLARNIGTMTEVQIKKNSLNGWRGKVEVPFHRKMGFDDVRGCIQYLLKEGHWSGNKECTNVQAQEFGFKGKVETLIQKIEEGNKEGKLRKLVRKVWNEIESELTPKRKKRYQ